MRLEPYLLLKGFKGFCAVKKKVQPDAKQHVQRGGFRAQPWKVREVMKRELLRQLSVITEEEKEILKGKRETERFRSKAGILMDAKKLKEAGRWIQMYVRTRFVQIPKHSHHFIELIYMCQGQVIYKINGERIVLEEGELLVVGQGAKQESLPAGEGDLAVHFLIFPEFFELIFQKPGQEENLIRDFLIEGLRNDPRCKPYLYFHVSDIISVQNLMENMVWLFSLGQPDRNGESQATMGLLFTELAHDTERLEKSSLTFEQDLILKVLRYIEQNYRDGQLGQLCAQLGFDVYWLSRAIKKMTGMNYKDILQRKRLYQAARLLLNTRAAISDISIAVGYDNTSYFHRIFREYYKVSPKEFRNANKIG